MPDDSSDTCWARMSTSVCLSLTYVSAAVTVFVLPSLPRCWNRYCGTPIQLDLIRLFYLEEDDLINSPMSGRLLVHRGVEISGEPSVPLPESLSFTSTMAARTHVPLPRIRTSSFHNCFYIFFIVVLPGIGYVLQKQHHQDIVLVHGRIDCATKRITAAMQCLFISLWFICSAWFIFLHYLIRICSMRLLW